MGFDLFSLKGRLALITGGTRGIGRMIAEGFIAAGCHRVYISGRNREACEATARDLGRNCVAIPQDISTVDGCRRLAALLAEREEKLDILVNNAGVDSEAPFSDFSEKDWDDVMDVNIKSPFFLTQALRPLLAAAASSDHPAKVINIASIDATRLNPIPAYSYYAAKSGLIWMTRRLGAELVQDHIVVTCIAPGSFPSDMNVAARDQADEVAARIPTGRVGRDEDMQGAAIYLASRAGDWVVGETIIVDGGVSLAKYLHPTPVGAEERPPG
jgi:NAD(P)-dependent dehydrogenase (short-subunit alcohol dehydrogenase family)